MAAKTEQVLLKVVSRDDFGRVRALEVVYDDEKVDLADPNNREFIILYCERGLMKRVNESKPVPKRVN